MEVPSLRSVSVVVCVVVPVVANRFIDWKFAFALVPYLHVAVSFVVTESVVAVVFSGRERDEDGMVMEGSVVSTGVVVLGAVLTTTVTSSVAESAVVVVAESLNMYVPALRLDTVV